MCCLPLCFVPSGEMNVFSCTKSPKKGRKPIIDLSADTLFSTLISWPWQIILFLTTKKREQKIFGDISQASQNCNSVLLLCIEKGEKRIANLLIGYFGGHCARGLSQYKPQYNQLSFVSRRKVEKQAKNKASIGGQTRWFFIETNCAKRLCQKNTFATWFLGSKNKRRLRGRHYYSIWKAVEKQGCQEYEKNEYE